MRRMVAVVTLIALLWSCSGDKGTNNPPSGKPETPHSPVPSDQAVNQAINLTLAWQCVDPQGDSLAYDVYLGTSNPPSLASSTFGVETCSVGPLVHATTYYWMIAARDNDANLVSGPVWSFTTEPAPTITDIDGNVYEIVTIGSQTWMKENLRVTHYRNGDSIPHVTENSAWLGAASGAYCNYDNSPDNVATYGRLYNGFILEDSRGVAPAGWHMPTDDEWLILERYLGMTNSQSIQNGWRGTTEGGKLKAQALWTSPNEGATNSSGFTALPAGLRYSNGSFQSLSSHTGYWTATLSGSEFAYARTLSYDTAAVYRAGYDKRHGLSIRCIRD